MGIGLLLVKSLSEFGSLVAVSAPEMLDVGEYSRYNVLQLICKIRGPLSRSVRSAQSSSKLPMRGAMMQLPIESLLESFPEGAAAIGPDTLILEVNSYLAERIGPCVGKACYEALAGLDEVCSFCPFEDLVAGLAGPEIQGIQVRQDTKCSVKARFVQQRENSFILDCM